ncbi:MAG: gluconate 5-dehydrogenase [Planctomycetaceae bacterium]|nr:gluconate 5-dehydrogenase [Planctomycetaceae bacterium]
MSDPLFSVTDQITLVSGGTRGIGRAIAEGFAQRGSRVIITGRDQSAAERAAEQIDAGPGEIVPIACDVASPDQIDQLVSRVDAQFERIDTLINVAGVNRRKPALEVSESDYDAILDVNLKGAFLLSQRVARVMLREGAGSQINIASLNTDRPLRNVLPYAVSKAGMSSMTRALALEWGPSGIRVNALAPGFVLTDLTRKLWSDETMQAWGLEHTPQRRLGVPEDMLGTAIFLASAASAFLTGQTIFVDGGFTAGWNWPIGD